MDIITLSQFQNEFYLVYNKSIDKQYIVDNELNEILIHINTAQNHKAFQKRNTLTFTNNLNGTFKKLLNRSNDTFFSLSFNNYMLEGKSETERTYNDTDATYQYKLRTTNQAYEFAEYYKWLKKLNSEPQKTEEENSMPIKQKLLALHYLGMDTSEHNHTKCAEILAEILGVGSENIRKSLSHLYAGKNNTVRTKNNFEKVKQLFDKQGLTAISNQIKDDLEKL